MAVIATTATRLAIDLPPCIFFDEEDWARVISRDLTAPCCVVQVKAAAAELRPGGSPLASSFSTIFFLLLQQIVLGQTQSANFMDHKMTKFVILITINHHRIELLLYSYAFSKNCYLFQFNFLACLRESQRVRHFNWAPNLFISSAW